MKEHNDHSSAPRPVTYYDGDCPMCRNFVAKLSDSVVEGQVEFKNFRQDSLPSQISPQAAEREIHFISEDGHVLRNIDAITKLWEYAGKYRLLRRFLVLPIIKPLARLVYKIVAANRLRL